MPRRASPPAQPAALSAGSDESRIRLLEEGDAPIAGVQGPGRWLVASYLPTALFSLKMSQATSSVGRTLVVPTMYAIKMAVVDAGFRARLPEAECATLLRSLVPVDVRIAPPRRAVVTHTFLKVRQEPKERDPTRPYISSVAYREMVYYQGTWQWAFDLAAGPDQLAEWLTLLLPLVNSIGKRGSFIQFVGYARATALSKEFTQPQRAGEVAVSTSLPPQYHLALLDDFGPEATLDVLNSYSAGRPRAEHHRIFTPTIVPLGLVNTGPGFTEYRG